MLGLSTITPASIWQQNATLFQMYIYETDYNEISIMEYPVVSLHCFHVVGLSITAAFEPVINMEHEAVIGVRPQNNMLHRRWDALPTYHQA